MNDDTTRNDPSREGGRLPQESETPGDFVKGVHEDPHVEETAAGGRSAQAEFEQRLHSLTEELQHTRDQALRSQADLDNYRKRTQRELAEERKYASLSLVRDLLPALDNLQRAIDAGQNVDDLAAMLEGVEMVATQIREILERHGAVRIEAVGQPFDPNQHEAIQQMPSSQHPPMTVVDEVEQGYRMYERIIRPSRVIVSTAPPDNEPADT